ncbi:putative 5-oxoprolinase [Aureobasidium pullulans]|nr:putative 5-oxoprolinase [Aureobasidium pullulans]
MPPRGVRIAIDRGGTFCDFWAQIPGQEEVIFKLLSVFPEEYSDAPTEGIRRILELATKTKIPPGTPLDLAPVESIRMGTTVATNALLERAGDPVVLVTTKGFRDLLKIGNQARPSIFDLSVERLQKLYSKVLEVDERVTIEGFAEDPNPQSIDIASDPALTEGLTGEAIRVLRVPDLDTVRRDLEAIWEEGFHSLAIAFVHSYTYPDHERAVAQVAREIGFKTLAVSSELQPMIKVLSRANSAVADAYLNPITQTYLDGFRRNFKGELKDSASANKLLLSQSDGGLTTFSRFTGLRAILSGPAGGITGYAKTCYDEKDGTPVLGFDMGGTSTDVSRFSGAFEHVFETAIAEVSIQCPQLDINTVAAGGGSMLFWRNRMFVVGPESAAANPGPACYGRNGPLTVTDANFLLGRIVPDYFPRPLDLATVKQKFTDLTELINAEKEGETSLTPEQVASGFLAVANATMTRPIRKLSEGRGFETAAHNLACFGGAGGQHAVAVARDLGIRRTLIPRYSSILSAYGMALADVVVENQQPEATTLAPEAYGRIDARYAKLCEKGTRDLIAQGFSADQVKHELFLNLRYAGTDTTLTVQREETTEGLLQAFADRHRQEFGFTQSREVLVDDVRVRSVGQAMNIELPSPFSELQRIAASPPVSPVVTGDSRRVFFADQGWTDASLYHLANLKPGVRIRGPALIIDKTQTIVLDAASEASILSQHVIIDLLDTERKAASTEVVDPIQLSVFSHRFMSVAEQMGQTMQKTSISVNIKERLDFSCAVFDSKGSLVCNAPHIPGHLGSMSYAIAYQARRYKPGELKPGDVILSNTPSSGGTHLPDLTVTTPVFDSDTNPTKIMFFVANRGHHADIGGIIPGSMPPNSTELWQEGAAVESFKMVKEGVFDESGLVHHLYHVPSSYPGCSGTRTLNDNLADLRAAVASNNRGIHLIQALVREYTWPVVEFYMQAIQTNAANAVRDLLKRVAHRFDYRQLSAIDYMDDGSPFCLNISIDGATGDATFDFTGSGPEAYNNLNCPPAIIYSGIMYCLRSLVPSDMPLNQGCLAPLKIVIPPETIISPSYKAATVGSNVETSQRIVDLIFKAFRACGASQGTCNNLTFGYGGKDDSGKVTKGFGYYETIAGGSGAGADWDGESGVHTHITNTRIGDPEVFEKRYPVLLHEFSIRKGSGGRGLHPGGDGCVRDIEFRVPLQVSILSERRVIPPYGMAGGEEGSRGVNIWKRRDPEDGTVRTISLGGKATVQMNAGDRIIIMTPGGGGYGVPPQQIKDDIVADFRIRSRGAFIGGKVGSGSVGEKQAMAQGN